MKRDYEPGTGEPTPGVDAVSGNAMVQDVMGAGTPAVESMTIRLWMSNIHAGTIIGKGGGSIKAIREQTGCKVTIAEAPMPGGERLVTIVGAPLSVHGAVELMLDKVDEAVAAAPEQAQQPANAPGAHALKLCMSQNQVGAVIGKGGAQIKEFREQSGATIKVEATSVDAPAVRSVTLAGGKVETLKAFELVALKLATVPDETAGGGGPGGHANKYQRTGQPPGMGMMGGGMGGAGMRPYYGNGQPAPQPMGGYSMQGMGAAPYRPYGAQPMGSYGAQPMGGCGGYGAQPTAQQMGSPVGSSPSSYAYQQTSFGGAQGFGGGAGAGRLPPPPSAPATSTAAYGAPSGGSYAASGYSFAGYDTPAYSMPPAAQPTAPPMSACGGAGGGGGWTAPTPTGGENGEMMQLVPSVLAGRLIGKGGSGIREMRDASRANIKILSDCEPGTDQRRITVSGSPEAVQMALALIRQKLSQGP